jgi:RNA polymerase sigma-70 factor (ECF subfamily)
MEPDGLYQAYYLKVYSYLMTLAKNQSLAEELTQETFVRALQHEKEFRQAANEFTWLCSIAKRLFYDEMRRAQRFSSDQVPETHSSHSMEDALAEEDSAYRLHVLLHELEEPYKEVFQLRVFGELSFRKIGQLFGKTENWARVTYHRARMKLQERMEQDESM